MALWYYLPEVVRLNGLHEWLGRKREPTRLLGPLPHHADVRAPRVRVGVRAQQVGCGKEIHHVLSRASQLVSE